MVRLLGEFKGYEKLAKNAKIVEQSADKYYGGQYQDVVRRVPSIKRAGEKLGWAPRIGFDDAVRRTIASYTETSTLPDTSEGWTVRR